MKPKFIELGVFKKQPGGFEAFIPHTFPPKSGIDFDAKILKKDNEATRLLGKLDGITKLLPDADFFLLITVADFPITFRFNIFTQGNGKS